ncbi:hypothetical protein BaRGS_00014904, partial [Batillaria attramentaria]
MGRGDVFVMRRMDDGDFARLLLLTGTGCGDWGDISIHHTTTAERGILYVINVINEELRDPAWLQQARWNPERRETWSEHAVREVQPDSLLKEKEDDTVPLPEKVQLRWRCDV